jgi:hypothetical protein
MGHRISSALEVSIRPHQLKEPMIVASASSPGVWMYVIAMPGMAMLARTEIHIKTKSIGLQCQAK